MRHPKVVEWERKLKAIFDEIDRTLEDEYAGRYRLHPARARHGSTTNPEHSGLFNIGASFTGGFGSEFGPGYLVDVDMVTLEHVPDEVEESIEDEVVATLRERLPEAFPGRNLRIDRDGHRFKIYGDLSLGRV